MDGNYPALRGVGVGGESQGRYQTGKTELVVKISVSLEMEKYLESSCGPEDSDDSDNQTGL